MWDIQMNGGIDTVKSDWIIWMKLVLESYTTREARAVVAMLLVMFGVV